MRSALCAFLAAETGSARDQPLIGSARLDGRMDVECWKFKPEQSYNRGGGATLQLLPEHVVKLFPVVEVVQVDGVFWRGGVIGQTIGAKD